MADQNAGNRVATAVRSGPRARAWLVLGVLLLGLGLGVAALRWERGLEGEPSHRLAWHYGLRLAIVGLALLAWFRSQALIASRPACGGTLADGLHDLTAPVLGFLQAHPRLANLVLALSSAGIDVFGLFLIGAAVFGPSMRPFLALLILFGLRQTCQALCALPPPPGMIWRHPGVPSLLVTYAVGNDFFFSGHTAVAVLGTLELARLSPALGVAGAIVAGLEASVVITLRAHYTMDVFAAAFAAWGSYTFALWVCGGG